MDPHRMGTTGAAGPAGWTFLIHNPGKYLHSSDSFRIFANNIPPPYTSWQMNTEVLFRTQTLKLHPRYCHTGGFLLPNTDYMALRDQPYLPLFIKDFVTDEKLIHCSPAAHGIMIRLMCLLHKEEVYGKLLLHQKYKQNGSKITASFALQLAKHFPFDSIDIEAGLDELFAADVIQIRGNVLSQKRMVRDGDISDKRASAGKTGGKKTSEKNKEFATHFATAKTQANTESEIESGITVLNNKGGTKKTAPVIELEFDKKIPFEKFWTTYDKKVGDKKKLMPKWDQFSLETQQAIMAYLPGYKLAQPNKKYRKDPATFFNNSSWQDELIFSNDAGKTHFGGHQSPTAGGQDPTRIEREGIGEL